MPYIKAGKSGAHNDLIVVINGYVALREKSLDDLCEIFRASENTVRKYLRSPEKMSHEMLMKLGRNLHIPIDEMRDCIRY